MGKVIYNFGPLGADGDASMKALLGGKGANLAEMAKLGCPVPPGFTIPTGFTAQYEADADTTMQWLMPRVMEAMSGLRDQFGYIPLVSVRSGAPVSMPGMMDTILNVGLNDQTVLEWAERIGERGAWDSYRRLIQMLGSTAFGVQHSSFEQVLVEAKSKAEVKEDKELPIAALKRLVAKYKAIFQKGTGAAFPQTLEDQLSAAIRAVFGSWGNERAEVYRKLNGITKEMGTAVNVQAMVFGNMNDLSGSGVLFTRNPATGEDKIMGEFLPNAQGEDVVAGIRTPMPLGNMAEMWPEVAGYLTAIVTKLEKHYRDMQDVEFTVQDGKLFILQCRNGKRSAEAAFRIAVEMVQDGLIDRKTALSRLKPEQFLLMKRPRVADSFKQEPVAVGLPACGGVAMGKVVTSSEEAVMCAAEGEQVILVTEETTPDDIAGMHASVGILTKTGGATSHAAVVARGMDKPCITGCGALEFQGGLVGFNGVQLLPGSVLSFDGATGRVWIGEVPVQDGSSNPHVAKMLSWLFEADLCLLSDSLEAPRCRVATADWYGEGLSAALDKLTAFLTVLQGMGDRSGVFLDLHPPTSFRRSEDALMWGVFGDSGDEAHKEGPIFLAIMNVLENQPQCIAGIHVVLPPGISPPKTWAGVGVKVAKVAETVADVLYGGAVTVTPEFIDKVLGGKDVLDRLTEAFGQLTALPRAATRTQAVFETLGHA